MRGAPRRFSMVVLLALILSVAGIPIVRDVRAQDATPPSAASPEASPVATSSARGDEFVSGVWRIGVVTAERENEFSVFGLDPRPDKDWIVVIADVTNWSRDDERLDPRDFAIEISGPTAPRGFARRSSESAAEALGLQPESVDDGVSIDATETERLVLVFEVPIDAVDPALYIDGDALPLTNSIDNGPALDNLPDDLVIPGETVRQTVESVESGNSLSVGGNGTLATLAFVDAPIGDECFATESTARLRRLATERVLLETDNGNAYIWTEESDGTRKLLNYEQIDGGFGAVPESVDGPFATWLVRAEEEAQASGGGLWSRCTGPHGVERTLDPEKANIRISDGEGGTTSYRVWLEWGPELVTTPDGGAWAFFSALADNGPNKDQQRLYASRFDPTNGNWTTAEPMAAGVVQFGATAAVDSQGIVHLGLFCARNAGSGSMEHVALHPRRWSWWLARAGASLDRSCRGAPDCGIAFDRPKRHIVCRLAGSAGVWQHCQGCVAAQC